MAKAIQLAVPQTYAALRRAVEGALLDGQRRVDEAKLRTYWETGWFIKEHILFNGDRAEYGTKVMHDLARDLNADKRTLYECLKFARLFPIVSRGSQLSWAHYRKFIQVADPVQRKALMAETIEEGLTGEQVGVRAAQLNAASLGKNEASEPPEPQQLLKPNRGTPGLHLIVEKTMGLSVDLGFRHYWPLKEGAARLRPYKAGDIVRIASDDSTGSTSSRPARLGPAWLTIGGASRLTLAPDATKTDLFTYAAQLVRVVDGDTLVVALEISPGEFLEQKLRLR